MSVVAFFSGVFVGVIIGACAVLWLLRTLPGG